MKVYVVSGESFIPHNEWSGNLGVFTSEIAAKAFINGLYIKAMDSEGNGYITETIKDKAFDDYEAYLYSPDGYYICWKIEEFEMGMTSD